MVNKDLVEEYCQLKMKSDEINLQLSKLKDRILSGVDDSKRSIPGRSHYIYIQGGDFRKIDVDVATNNVDWRILRDYISTVRIALVDDYKILQTIPGLIVPSKRSPAFYVKKISTKE